ncbi:ribonuclease H-like domain-containing protein, partial [Pacificimonas aurantium]
MRTDSTKKETPGLRRIRGLLRHIRLSAPRTLFLDIETTGLSRHYHRITVVGYTMDGCYRAHVAGDDPAAFVEAASSAEAVVTFNGSQFDLPFLAKEYPDVLMPERHIDLRYACRYAGLTGGQKKIEKALGFERESDVDGAEAVLLWHRYVSGDHGALSRLIEYNYLDVTGMATLFDCVENLLCGEKELFDPVGFADRCRPLRDTLLRNHPPASARGFTPLGFDELFAGTAAE